MSDNQRQGEEQNFDPRQPRGVLVVRNRLVHSSVSSGAIQACGPCPLPLENRAVLMEAGSTSQAPSSTHDQTPTIRTPRPALPEAPPARFVNDPDDAGDILCKRFVGGLLRHYYRAAA